MTTDNRTNEATEAHVEAAIAARDSWHLASDVWQGRAERAEARIAEAAKLHEPDAVFKQFCSECSDFGTDEYPAGLMVQFPCPTAIALGLNEGENENE